MRKTVHKKISVKGRYALRLLMSAACLVLFMLSSALSEPCKDYPVKAGFIYNFAIFIDWPEPSPPGTKTSLNVCVTDMGAVGQDLNTLANKTVKGRNGLDAAEEIRRHMNVPIIFLTGYSDSETIERIEMMDQADHIFKPIKKQNLEKLIQNILKNSGALRT